MPSLPPSRAVAARAIRPQRLPVIGLLVIALARKALKWDVPITGPWTLSFPNFIQKAGSAAEGVTNYDRPFSAQDHAAITANMLVMGEVTNGRVGFANSADAKNAAVVKTKR